jgi:hypothetical protein
MTSHASVYSLTGSAPGVASASRQLAASDSEGVQNPVGSGSSSCFEVVKLVGSPEGTGLLDGVVSSNVLRAGDDRPLFDGEETAKPSEVLLQNIGSKLEGFGRPTDKEWYPAATVAHLLHLEDLPQWRRHFAASS